MGGRFGGVDCSIQAPSSSLPSLGESASQGHIQGSYSGLAFLLLSGLGVSPLPPPILYVGLILYGKALLPALLRASLLPPTHTPSFLIPIPSGSLQSQLDTHIKEVEQQRNVKRLNPHSRISNRCLLLLALLA